jgi:hypothetical protein
VEWCGVEVEEVDEVEVEVEVAVVGGAVSFFSTRLSSLYR